MKYRELTPKEEREWLFMNLIASPEIAENEGRLREAQELIIIGFSIALEYDKRN